MSTNVTEERAASVFRTEQIHEDKRKFGSIRQATRRHIPLISKRHNKQLTNGQWPYKYSAVAASFVKVYNHGSGHYML